MVAALDRDTCELCGSMDGQVFKMSDYQVGLTAPPFHPWCRCCTCPCFDDMTGERWARDAVTGETFKVPGDMTYEQWKAMQDAKWGEGTVDLQRRMSYNELIDKQQWKQYKELLGKNAPPTFAEYQTIRYSSDWHDFKAYVKAIEMGELTPLADFKLYRETSKAIDAALVGATTQNGILITGKSNHFIARIIGSIEQRRSGVGVSEALQTLLHPIKVDPVIINTNGKSQRFIGNGSAVTINPDTGVLIQVNPLHRKT